MGECYYCAIGIDKDEKAALKWFEAAAKQENVTAQYMAGRLFAELSYNVPAERWYQKAAEQGSPDAQYELGKC